MNATTFRVKETEAFQRSLNPYYRGNVVSALGDLLAEKAGVSIGLASECFECELNRIAAALGAMECGWYFDSETRSHAYIFYT